MTGPVFKTLHVDGICIIVQKCYTNCIRKIYWQYKKCTRLLFVKDFNRFWITIFFFLSTKDYTLSCYTFIHHIFIIYTLFNSHMRIQILTSLIMFEEKFSFYVFHHFLNQIIRKMVNPSYVDTLFMHVDEICTTV